MNSTTSSIDEQSFWALTTDIFCVFDKADGRMHTVRGGWTTVTGFSDSELRASSLYSLMHPEEEDAVRIKCETVTEAQESGRFSGRIRSKDGTYHHIEWAMVAGQSPEQVCALGRDVTEFVAIRQSARFNEILMDQVAKGAPVVISVYDREGTILLHVGAGLEKLGLQQNQLRGMSVFEAFKGADDALAMIRGALDGQQATNLQDLGTTMWDNWFCPTRDEHGNITGAISISTDVTERVRAAQALEERLRVIEEQGRAIRVMSAPIIEVWQGVLVVPVVGQLDEASATDMMERLLSTVVQRAASFAILDLTAVDRIEPSTAEHLLRMIHALGLLGTEGLLSGIGPSVARALIELGIDLSKVTSVSSLHAALRSCMGETRRKTSR